MRRSSKVTISLAGLCAAGLALVYWAAYSSSRLDESEVRPEGRTEFTQPHDANALSQRLSPFDVKPGGDTEKNNLSAGIDSLQVATAAASESALDPDPASASAQRKTLPHTLAAELDITALGQAVIDDQTFEQLVVLLRQSPDLLLRLVDEFRQETDPVRRDELARLLGEVGGEQVTLAASELIYSGDADSRRLGLELLQQVQPGNTHAQDIVSSLLATEIEPDVLVNTLTTLAVPGAVGDVSRQFLSDQVAYLARHADVSVRSISLSVLSRWNQADQYTAVIVDGLADNSPRVRESAAYSLVGYTGADENVIDSLLSIALDSGEQPRTRRGAILALKGMSIPSSVKDQLLNAEQTLDIQSR